MPLSLSASVVCFIACHGGSAEHFAVYADDLAKKGCHVQIYASGSVFKKFQDCQVDKVVSFSLEDISEEEAAARVARQCGDAAVVITDVGHIFDLSLQKALSDWAPKALRLAYYDNPEPYVPGGYSAVAAKVMSAAQGVLFANANLAKTAIYQAPSEEIQIPLEKRGGIGFYPVGQAEKILQRRKSDQGGMRAQFFAKYGLMDKGQKVFVYAGGNNEEYFAKAFPAFLQFLAALAQEADLSDYVVLLQQHPGAKGKNRDGILVQEWIAQYGQAIGSPKILVSDLSTDDAQVLADGMLYYQTSMGPQFVLAGIPTIQVGHESYADILVKNKLCAVANSKEELQIALANLEKGGRLESDVAIHQGLGIHSDWAERLANVLQKRAIL